MVKRDGLVTPNSPRNRLIFKPHARSSSGLKALSGRRSCDFRRNPWHWRDRTPHFAPVPRRSFRGVPGLRVIAIDSDERRGYERAQREQAMERARQHLEKLGGRVASSDLKQPEKVGAAVERVMQKYHGYRYFDWKLTGGVLEFSESESSWVARRRSRVNMW